MSYHGFTPPYGEQHSKSTAEKFRDYVKPAFKYAYLAIMCIIDVAICALVVGAIFEYFGFNIIDDDLADAVNDGLNS